MFFWRKKRRPARGNKPTRVLVRQIVLGVASILLVALIGAGVWYGTRIEALTIGAVNVTGGETIPHEAIRIEVEGQLAGSYFALVPHRFAWTYPEEAIEAAVREYDRVKDVTVRREDSDLTIAFTEYEPVALWCAAEGASCLFLDRDGYAFGMAPNLSGGTFVRYIDPIREPVEGEYAYDAAQSDAFRAFADAIETQYGLSVVGIMRIAPHEISYLLAGGGVLKVNEEVALETTLTNLATVLESNEFAHLTNGNFAYIDLRYGNRVFVNEEGDLPVAEEKEEIEDEVVEEESVIDEVEDVETETAASEDAAE